MLKVHFDAMRGLAVPDGAARGFVDDIITTRNPHAGDYEIVIGTDTIVTQFRLAVADRRIPHEDIVFVFNGENIPLNRYGDLNHWPIGFDDHTTQALTQLCSIKRRKDPD